MSWRHASWIGLFCVVSVTMGCSDALAPARDNDQVSADVLRSHGGAIASVTESEIDLGQIVYRGERVEETVTVGMANTGDQPLRIFELETSCGCTSARLDRHEIDPGYEATLELRVAINAVESRRVKVQIETNAKDHSSEYVTIKWNAVSPFTIVPSRVDFGRVTSGQTCRAQCQVTFREDVVCGDTQITVNVSDDLIRSGIRASASDHFVNIELVTVESGEHHCDIWVEVPGCSSAPVAIPVHWELPPAISVSPESIYLGAVKPGQEVTRRVVVEYAEALLEDDDLASDRDGGVVRWNRISRTQAVGEVTYRVPHRPGLFRDHIQFCEPADGSVELQVGVSGYVLKGDEE